MNVNLYRAWVCVRQASSMPGNGPPIGDLLANGWTGVLVQPDDPHRFDIAIECFKQGMEFGLWCPDREKETEVAYIGRVDDAIRELDGKKLNPHHVKLNPEHNGKGRPDNGKGQPDIGWLWFQAMIDEYRRRRSTRLTTVDVPGKDAFYNLPSALKAGMNVSLQCFGGESLEFRFDPGEVVDFAYKNQFVGYSVDPRRVSLVVAPAHIDWLLEPVTRPGFPQPVPRLLAAGARGLCLYTIEDDQIARNYRKLKPLLPLLAWKDAA